MQVLNFTATQILPSLLKFFETKGKEGKNQTIRKAWRDIKQRGVIDVVGISGEKFGKIVTKQYIKPPPHKVGEELELQWDRDNKDKVFCKVCGNGENHKNHILTQLIFGVQQYSACVDFKNMVPYQNWFNKTLGIVKVTAVFKIEMNNQEIIANELNSNVPILLDTSVKNDLAKRDGFKTAKDLFCRMFSLSLFSSGFRVTFIVSCLCEY